jgi:hypothetical protein
MKDWIDGRIGRGVVYLPTSDFFFFSINFFFNEIVCFVFTIARQARPRRWCVDGWWRSGLEDRDRLGGLETGLAWTELTG